MIIECKTAKSIPVCGVAVHPGKYKYLKLSLKNVLQRQVLLTLRDSGLIDFESEDGLKNEDGTLKEVSLDKVKNDVAKSKKRTAEPGANKPGNSSKGKLPKKGN